MMHGQKNIRSCIMGCSWGNKIYTWITSKTRITFYRFTGTKQN